MWYLLATSFAVVVITLALSKKISLKSILLTGGGIYIIGLLGQSYFELLRPLQGTVLWTLFKLYQKVFITTRNGIFEGILFVGLGALFAYKKIELKRNVAVCGFAVSMVLLLIEAFCVKYFELLRECDMYLCLVPAVFFLFYITAHLKIKISALTGKMRVYSSLIYFTHIWIDFPILSIVRKIIEKCTGVEAYEIHSLVRFAIVLTGSLLASYIIIRLQENRYFQWLKSLY